MFCDVVLYPEEQNTKKSRIHKFIYVRIKKFQSLNHESLDCYMVKAYVTQLVYINTLAQSAILVLGVPELSFYKIQSFSFNLQKSLKKIKLQKIFSWAQHLGLKQAMFICGLLVRRKIFYIKIITCTLPHFPTAEEINLIVLLFCNVYYLSHG